MSESNPNAPYEAVWSEALDVGGADLARALLDLYGLATEVRLLLVDAAIDLGAVDEPLGRLELGHCEFVPTNLGRPSGRTSAERKS